jgi:hypothetical protein
MAPSELGDPDVDAESEVIAEISFSISTSFMAPIASTSAF